MGRLVSLAAAVLLAGCSGGGDSCLDRIDAAKAQGTVVREAALDPSSLGGTRITDAELEEIRSADDAVVEAERCLSES